MSIIVFYPMLQQERGKTHCGECRQAAGVAASKVIGVPVPMSAFGGKADIAHAR
jgi:hypothetical protein